MRESSVSRVLKTSPEGEAAIIAHFKKQFSTRFEIGTGDVKVETKKSPELTNAIETISRCMHPFFAQYGAKALEIRPDQVHFIEKNKVPPGLMDTITENDGAAGHFQTDKQWIFILIPENSISKRDMARVIAHEMIHFNSFSSVQLELEKGEVTTRRVGIQARSGGFMHFRELNEAVTEELAIRFGEQYFKRMTYTEEETQTKEGLENFDQLNTPRIVGDLVAYPDERVRLHKMIDDIFNANKEKFADKDEVFTIFANAMIQGRMLPLARLINKTYGKGHFSQLAEEMEELIKTKAA